MKPQLVTVEAEGVLHRVGRPPDVWAWPDWSYVGTDGTFGNRYDDPGGEYRVLYAGSERVGAFVEVLARFRPDPLLVDECAHIENDEEYPTIAPGLVPVAWPEGRHVGTARHVGHFVDVGHSDSLAHLRVALAKEARRHGIPELDGSSLRLKAPRALTQGISRYVYAQGSDDEPNRIAGIRYLSRLGDDLENWAMFEGTQPEDCLSTPLERDDPDLVAALAKLGIRLGK